MAKKSSADDVPDVSTPEPIAPVSPTAKGSEKVAIAGKEEKERIKKAMSHQKTLLSRNNQDNSNSNSKTTLG